MRVAAIYDIHANLPALEAVIEDIRQAKVGQIMVGGDVVPGPMCRETIAYLLDLDIPALFIQGNGDREVAAQINGIETDWFRTTPERWREPVRSSAQQLDAEHVRTQRAGCRGAKYVAAGKSIVIQKPIGPPVDQDQCNHLGCRPSVFEWGYFSVSD